MMIIIKEIEEVILSIKMRFPEWDPAEFADKIYNVMKLVTDSMIVPPNKYEEVL